MRCRYTIKNVSRTWAYETSVLLNKEVDNNIPYNNFIEWYAPTYQLHLTPTNMENKNSHEYLDNLLCVLRGRVTCSRDVTEHLRAIEGAPSIAMQETPRVWNTEKQEKENPEEREDSEGEGGFSRIELCIDEHKRSESEFYDGPTDIDHDDGAKEMETQYACLFEQTKEIRFVLPMPLGIVSSQSS